MVRHRESPFRDCEISASTPIGRRPSFCALCLLVSARGCSCCRSLKIAVSRRPWRSTSAIVAVTKRARCLTGGPRDLLLVLVRSFRKDASKNSPLGFEPVEPNMALGFVGLVMHVVERRNDKIAVLHRAALATTARYRRPLAPRHERSADWLCTVRLARCPPREIPSGTPAYNEVVISTGRAAPGFQPHSTLPRLPGRGSELARFGHVSRSIVIPTE